MAYPDSYANLKSFLDNATDEQFEVWLSDPRRTQTQNMSAPQWSAFLHRIVKRAALRGGVITFEPVQPIDMGWLDEEAE